jgi:hypothetical protein
VIREVSRNSHPKMRWTFTVLGLLGCTTQACAGSTGSCDARKASAIAEVQKAVDTNLGCMSDADCKVVDFQSGCFDACTRVVNAAGVVAVKSAIDRVNANGCANFTSDGCNVVIPPCAPPSSPSCAAGRCM